MATSRTKIVIERDVSESVVDCLANSGYRVIGPTARDGSIIYDNRRLIS